MKFEFCLGPLHIGPYFFGSPPSDVADGESKAVVENKMVADLPAAKKVAEVARELLDREAQAGELSERWTREIKGKLSVIGKKLDLPFDQVKSKDLNAMLFKISKNPYTRRGYWTALGMLIRFARQRHYLPPGWDEFSKESVRPPRLPKIGIKVLTAGQLKKLFNAAPEILHPFIALTAFAGIRHEEMCCPGEPVLGWETVDIPARNIYVPADVAKTGEDRNVPMVPCLAAWLERHHKPTGPVCPLANARNPLVEAKRLAGIPCGRNETKNTLRKSFISYRLATVKHIGQVAEEAGNSPVVIRRYYRKAALPAAAQEWFSVMPSVVDQLSLFPDEERKIIRTGLFD